MENKGILVYCITEGFDERISEISGLDDSGRLYAVSSGALLAIVSDVDLEEYGEEQMAQNGENIEWLKERATVFMDVMLKVMDITSIIPMKFLTIFLTEDRVAEIIDENSENFKETFGKISGRDEYSVKIYCDHNKFKELTMAAEIEKFDKSLAGKPKGAAFFLKKKFEGELDEKLQSRIFDIANRFAEKLGTLAFEMKSNRILAREITGIEMPMILNCAYLVETSEKDTFAENVEEFRRTFGGSGFDIDLSGPWPPYSFC